MELIQEIAADQHGKGRSGKQLSQQDVATMG